MHTAKPHLVFLMVETRSLDGCAVPLAELSPNWPETGVRARLRIRVHGARCRRHARDIGAAPMSPTHKDGEGRPRARTRRSCCQLARADLRGGRRPKTRPVRRPRGPECRSQLRSPACPSLRLCAHRGLERNSPREDSATRSGPCGRNARGGHTARRRSRDFETPHHRRLPRRPRAVPRGSRRRAVDVSGETDARGQRMVFAIFVAPTRHNDSNRALFETGGRTLILALPAEEILRPRITRNCTRRPPRGCQSSVLPAAGRHDRAGALLPELRRGGRMGVASARRLQREGVPRYR